MSIIKEKKFLLLGLSLLFITLATGSIQYSEYQIQKHQDLIQNKLLMLARAGNSENFYSNQRLLVDNLKILCALDVCNLDFNVENDCADTELATITTQCQQKVIDKNECLKKFSKHFYKKVIKYQREYNNLSKELEPLLQEKPKCAWRDISWQRIRLFAYIILIISIITSFSFYLWLFISIGKKYYTRVENENKRLKIEVKTLKNKNS